MSRILWVPWLCLALLVAGCQQSATAPPPAAGTNQAVAKPPPPVWPPGAEVWPPTNAQPKLATIKLFVGPETVETELALTPVQVGTGMMFRKQMAENEGMLFVFARPHRPAFYMKNTIVPLTVAYIDSEGTIVELHDLQPLNETAVEAGSDSIQFVLEMKQGWFQRHNVGPGAVITSEKGRLLEIARGGR
jgi:uncharacterized membrane protein (UPF0127 family)